MSETRYGDDDRYIQSRYTPYTDHTLPRRCANYGTGLRNPGAGGEPARGRSRLPPRSASAHLRGRNWEVERGHVSYASHPPISKPYLRQQGEQTDPLECWMIETSNSTAVEDAMDAMPGRVTVHIWSRVRSVKDCKHGISVD